MIPGLLTTEIAEGTEGKTIVELLDRPLRDDPSISVPSVLSVVQEFRVECAWCKCHIRGPLESERVSHGMCEECAAKWTAEI